MNPALSLFGDDVAMRPGRPEYESLSVDEMAIASDVPVHIRSGAPTPVVRDYCVINPGLAGGEGKGYHVAPS